MTTEMFDSNTVSDVLDWVGFSPSEISWRIQTWKTVESMKNVSTVITGQSLSLLTGSRAEGVGLKTMGSDIDVMFEDKTKCVIFNFGDWQLLFDKLTFVVDTSDIHPGYCRLKPTHIKEPIFIHFDKIGMHNDMEIFKGELVLRSTNLCVPYWNRQGPAHTCQMGGVSLDAVECCQTYWPPGAREWIDRDRPSKYPPVYFIQEADRRGIHVVPTGYKGSEHQNLEWRFSFSVTELDLVHMWPNAVFKCYVLLKLLKKDIVRQSPHLTHTLSSYHLKTLMFWLTEETGLDYWNINSLMKCLKLSLAVLLRWVERGCIPHYFMRTNNMFDMEAGTLRQSYLITALRVLVSDGPLVLTRCETYRNWYAENNRIQHTIRLPQERVSLHFIFGKVLIDSCIIIISHLLSEDIHKSIVHITDAMRELTVFSTQCDHDVSMGIDYIICVLRSICATILLSFLQKNLVSNTRSYILLKMSEQMLNGPIDYVFVQLKMANLYFQTRRYQRATQILQLMTEKNHGRIKIDFFEFREECSAADEERISMIESPFHAFSTQFASVLLFMFPEIHDMPYALKFELFKPDKPPSNLLEAYIYYQRKQALVDSDVFIYYLQYMCYRQMGKQRHAEIAFNNLQWAVCGNNVICKETGLNILGHCFLERGQLHHAIHCFVKSLRVQSKYTVTPIHLAVLIGKAIKHK